MGPRGAKRIGKSCLTPKWSGNLGPVDASMAADDKEPFLCNNAVSGTKTAQE